MPLTSPFQRRRVDVSEQSSASTQSVSASRSIVGRGLPLLWPWAANANRSKLSGITLAHVLSGDTVSPISFPEFEAFLAFCDISLENLQFVVWYQDYRKRFEALQPDEQARSPSPHVLDARVPSDDFAERSIRSTTSAGTFKPLEPRVQSGTLNENKNGSAREDASDTAIMDISSTNLAVPTPGDLIPGKGTTNADTQPFRLEVQNVLATFIVPGARKELSLSSDMRESIIRESSRTTHLDVFSGAYNAIYETVECVSLPRFLENASTNINRPRQLFWYFSALPFFLLGVSLALLFILSPSHLHLFIVPPQSHRAWRLFSVLSFMLSSMMWYKGFRGFCPLLFLRSSRQLRLWELEHMVDDKEAQAYCISLSQEPESKDTNPLTPTSPVSCSSANARIAPFIEDTGTKENGYEPDTDVSGSRSTDIGGKGNNIARANDQFRSMTRNGFRRPPIFGPGHVVEDERIRAVHMHLWWSLVRFGLFWALVSAAIVLSVPSLY